MTVGVAGLLLGGGFGSYSKRFGSAAASLLEAEIVTADGRVRVVNECMEPDLFWALKGGGGGPSFAPCLAPHGYTQWTSFQPASRFCPFQWIEGGWLLALSVLLVAATIWLVRRRAA